MQDSRYEIRIFLPQGKLRIGFQSAADRGGGLAGYGVKALLFFVDPIQTNPAFLPGGEIVEIDPILEEKLVLIRRGLPLQLCGGVVLADALLPQQPVAMGVQGVAVGILLPPEETKDSLLLWRSVLWTNAASCSMIKGRKTCPYL